MFQPSLQNLTTIVPNPSPPTDVNSHSPKQETESADRINNRPGTTPKEWPQPGSIIRQSTANPRCCHKGERVAGLTYASRWDQSRSAPPFGRQQAQIEGIAEQNVGGDGTSVSSAEANQLSPPHNDVEYLSLRYMDGRIQRADPSGRPYLALDFRRFAAKKKFRRSLPPPTSR